MMKTPKKGMCPIPILPALVSENDTAFYAVRDVPHGKVIQAAYINTAGKDKRMHVYLPPDYDETADTVFPVLYLNHAGRDDDAWWTAAEPETGGRAHLILDNLIAERKAKPMIIVMPDTSDCATGTPPEPGRDDACTIEYLKDIIPFVEARFRVKRGRENRALAGASMGGFVVMNTGFSHLDTFSELYVFSSGYRSEAEQKAFEVNFRAVFKDPNTNDLLRVPFYMAQGETDIALLNGQKVMSVIHKYGIRNFWVFSSGGHEWKNWCRYLHQTAQIMFPENRQ
jgi:enterochelin esterase family protein